MRMNQDRQEFLSAVAVVARTIAARWYDGIPDIFPVSAEPALPEGEKLFSRKEAAFQMSVSVATIDRLRKQKKLKAVNVGGSSPRYRLSDLKKLLE